MSQPLEGRESDPALRLLMGFQPLRDGTRDKTLVIERGQGVFVYDASGKEYLEACSSFYVASLGYGDPALIETATRQMERLSYYPSAAYKATPPAIELAEALAERAPIPDARVAFAASGSEANDFLLKFVRFRNRARGDGRRTKVIARVGSYHGGTLASASLTGGHHEEFGLPLEGILHTVQPDFVNLAREGESEEAFAERVVGALAALLEREGPETIAAFLTEPVSFSCGLVMPPATYFERLQALLREHGILYLDDEVVTGFGRTGQWFGCESFGIEPDALCVGKGLSSGFFPISAIALSGEFFDDLRRGSDEIGMFAHAATFAGHPVGAAIALEVLAQIEKRDLVRQAREVTGPLLQAGVARYAEHPLVKNTRGIGLAAAVEFAHDGNARPLEPSSRACQLFCQHASDEGLLVRGTGASVVLAPPLVITEAEVEELFARFDRAISKTEREL